MPKRITFFSHIKQIFLSQWRKISTEEVKNEYNKLCIIVKYVKPIYTQYIVL